MTLIVILRQSQEILKTMWLDLANLFNTFEVSIANPFQVNSVTPLGLWSPFKVKNINALEKVQHVFTKHIDGMHDLQYTECLLLPPLAGARVAKENFGFVVTPNLQTTCRRFWKEKSSTSHHQFSQFQCHISVRWGRLCSSGVVPTGHLGTRSVPQQLQEQSCSNF